MMMMTEGFKCSYINSNVMIDILYLKKKKKNTKEEL